MSHRSQIGSASSLKPFYIMSRISLFFSFLLVFAFAFSPQTQAQDGAYERVEYMKVKPGQRANYLAAEQVWRKLHEARLKAGKITYWYMFQVLIPSGTNTEYDYMIVTGFKNWDAIEEVRLNWDREMPDLTEEEREIMQQTGDYRDLVKTEIWSAHTRITASPNQGPSKYHVENFATYPAGGFNAWVDTELTMAKPVHEMLMKEGKLKSWMMLVMDSPWGTDAPYKVSTVDAYDNWSDIKGGYFPDYVGKVHGEDKISDVFASFSKVRTVVRSEIRMLVDAVR